MSSSKDMEEYYQRVIQLQEKLRRSEEERLELEMKYNEMIQHIKEEEEAHLKKIRSKYKQFLEEDRRRQQRNDKILDALGRIENRSTAWEAKTKKFKAFRKRFQHYLKPSYEIDDQGGDINDYLPTIYSTKATKYDSIVKPEDKFSNLGNVNSIYRKTARENTQQDYDCTKTSKDFQNSLKQNIKPNATDSLNVEKDLSGWDYSDKLFQGSPEEVHCALKRSLKVDENLTSTQPKNYERSFNDVIPKTQLQLHSKLGDKNTEKPQARDYFKSKTLEADSHKNEDKLGSKYLADVSYVTSKSEAAPLPRQNQKQFDDVNIPVSKSAIEAEQQPKIQDSRKPLDLIANNKNLSAHKVYESKKENKDDLLQIQTRKEDVQPISGKNVAVKELRLEEQKCELETDTDGQNEYERGNQQNIDDVQQSTHVLRQNENNDQFVENNDQFVENNDQFVENAQPSDQSAQQYDEKTDSFRQYEESQLHAQYEETGEPSQQKVESVQGFEDSQVHDQYGESGQENQQNISLKQYADDDQSFQQYEESQLHARYEESVQPSQSAEQQHDVNGQSSQQYAENQVLNQYDDSGQPVQQYGDEIGQSFQQYGDGYDENGQLIQQYDESGQPIPYYDENQTHDQYYNQLGEYPQYDENGQIIQQYDENGQIIQQYDEHGQIIQQYDENGQIIQQYDEHGQIMQQYDENGQIIQQYDENGQPLQQYYDNQMLQYDENGQPLLQYDENAPYDENAQPIDYDPSKQCKNNETVEQVHAGSSQLSQSVVDEDSSQPSLEGQKQDKVNLEHTDLGNDKTKTGDS